MEIIKGNLLDSHEKIIAHGCNVRGVMGAGIAAQVARRWPFVLKYYEDTCRVGTFLPGAVQPVDPGDPLGPEYVVNMATQINPGPDARLHLIALAFGNLAEWMAYNGHHRVAIPKIGCGIGGLAWDDVERTIDLAMHDVYLRGHAIQVVCYILP